MESSIFPKTSAWGSWKFSAWHFSPNQSKKKKGQNPKPQTWIWFFDAWKKGHNILPHGGLPWMVQRKIALNKSKQIATKLVRVFTVSHLLYFELQQSDVQSQWQITCLCPFIWKFPQLIAASEEMRWKIYIYEMMGFFWSLQRVHFAGGIHPRKNHQKPMAGFPSLVHLLSRGQFSSGATYSVCVLFFFLRGCKFCGSFLFLWFCVLGGWWCW